MQRKPHCGRSLQETKCEGHTPDQLDDRGSKAFEGRATSAQRCRPGPLARSDTHMAGRRSNGPIYRAAQCAQERCDPVGCRNDVPPSNDALAAPEPKAPSPVAVSVSFSTSAAVPTERSKSTVPTAIIKPDIYVKPDSYFAPVDRDRMISLRWVLRDIRSKRLNWWPINQPDLQLLIEMELVEMRDGIAVLTNKGERAID